MPIEEDDECCRYCFEGVEAGPLISPCDCRGDQKYVHLSCLRRWQRTVLVSQPTHPAFYERDARHYTCNVCKGTFTCEPPTRHELMASFTGPELGALIQAGCVIGSHASFSAELASQIESMPPFLRTRSPYAHWVSGCFLITEVAPLDPTLNAPISSEAALAILKERLATGNASGPLRISSNGQGLRLVPGGALADVAEDDLADALAGLSYSAGMRLVLARDPPPGIGDDHVTAINLTRPIEAVDTGVVSRAREAAVAKHAGAKHVQITHYIGGPCDEESISCCVVPGGHGCGWTVVQELSEAIELAYSRSYVRSEKQGAVHGGQSVTLVGLQARPDLNGEVGIALWFTEDTGRWLVRLKDGEGKQIKPANLKAFGPEHGVVHCVWGDAQVRRAHTVPAHDTSCACVCVAVLPWHNTHTPLQ